ncbi:transmembrane protein 65 isoform X2 [Anastrepha ludens]|uniref:transmembrane protein 65 isoform X2 n=1 Tax=Anastrepha ludens TaxID=28586 RepID=UPI0023B19B99|nr:transmembrane protein 65 isoform X2 [Anastrepha ludens]
MQAEKFLLTRFARTCLRLIQTKQKQTCQQQSLLSQLEKQRKPFHVLGGIKLDINTIFTANAGNVAGDFSQRRYQHYLLPRFQNKQPNSHSNLVSCYNNDNNNVNFRQQKANIYTQSTTPLRGKYPTDTVHEPLCSERARELVYKLKDSEREAIKVALLKYDSERQRLGLEAAKAPAPTMADLRRICVVNAVPFLAFGFLDNFVMIVAGDSIESIFGAFMCISTMAAAGLGNTVSDILGIGSAYYVERGCEMMGFRLPDLTPIQMEMKSSRHAANLGRIVGITIGCLLGMMPLMFMKKKDKTENVAVNEDANVIGVTPVKC